MKADTICLLLSVLLAPALAEAQQARSGDTSPKIIPGQTVWAGNICKIVNEKYELETVPLILLKTNQSVCTNPPGTIPEIEKAYASLPAGKGSMPGIASNGDARCTPEVVSTTGIGGSCKTSAGQTFSFVADPQTNSKGWKDTSPGSRTWFIQVGRDLDYDSSESFCMDKGQQIPTEADFRNALNHGFAELIKPLAGQRLWVQPNANASSRMTKAYVVSRGTFEYGKMESSKSNDPETKYYSVVCVSK